MQIKKTIDKIPGGLMLIPLFLGALCKTFFPDAGSYLGSFSSGLINGTLPILGVWMFCVGTSIEFKATGTMLRKSGVLVLTKIATAWIIAIIAGTFWTNNYVVEGGIFAGFSVLALVASMDMTNGGLYAALMNQYGSKEEAGAFLFMSFESGPLITMVVLGTSGIAAFEPQLFIGAMLPFLIGFILANFDPEFRKMFSGSVQTLIPFFAFSLGNGINFQVILDTGLGGILLGLGVIVVTGIPLVLCDKFIGGGNGTAGIAASSTAGAAVATPILIGEMAPEFKELAPAATALVATSVVVTALVVPVLTSFWAKRFGINKVSNI